MIGRKIAVLALAGAFVLTPAAAMADVKYPPPPPPEASLEGSSVSPVCDADAPYLNYNIVVTDPGKTVDPSITTATITFVNPSGSNWSTTVPLGSGRILWPGASVTGGVADGWPGYAYDAATGTYVPVGNDNFGWSRASGTEVLVEVNPSMSFAVNYPPSTPTCATSPTSSTLSNTGTKTAAAPTLSTTGFESMPMALGAGALLLAGAVTVVMAARRTSAGSRS